MLPNKSLKQVHPPKTNPESSKFIEIISQNLKNCFEEFSIDLTKTIADSYKQIQSIQCIKGEEIQEEDKMLDEIEVDQSELTSTVSSYLRDSEFQTNNFNRMQARFQNISIPIPKLKSYPGYSKQRQKVLREWLGVATKQIFSVGFNYFETKQFDQQDVKIYCSENLLENIIKLVRKNNIVEEELSMMNSVLRKELLPYYSLKYPHSTEPQVNLAFANKIIETDNFNSNSNDLIFRSGIKFRYEKDENYNPQIMKFINFLLDLYQKEILTDSGKQYPLSALFQKQMSQLFQKVQLQDQVKLMSLYNPKSAGFEKSNSSNSKSQDPDKYREKVQSYTNYLIGRKISKDIRKFTDSEIDQGCLKLRIPSVMRIVTKWCEQLKRYFQDDQFVLNRSEQFRMRDKSENFLNKTYRKILHNLLKKQNDKIKEYLEQVMKNNIQSQKYFINWSKNEKLSIYCKNQSSIGLFSSAIRENCENYQVGYLNKLIHGLLTVNEKFLKILCLEVEVPRVYNKFVSGQISSFQQLQEHIQQNIPNFIIQKYRVEMEKKIPQFISFKIGDLLRCRCFSKEKQIIALYCELQQISQYDKSRMKIVRVKNKLEKGTKDILINILFYDSILIEVQLGINQKQSQFSICASKFQHYIYELQRASFGPISQLCNVWWTLDQRGQFYREKFHSLNLRKTQKNKFHDCYKSQFDLTLKSLKMIIRSHQSQSQYKKIALPFVCQYCNCYYSRIMPLQKHLKCITCSKNVCFLCYLDSCSRLSLVLSIGKKTSSSQKTRILEGQNIPQRGEILNLKAKNEQYKLYKKIVKRNITYIYQIVDLEKGTFTLLKILPNVEKLNKFLRQNIVISSEEVVKKLQDVTDLAIYLNYEIPETFNKALQKKSNSIALVGEGLNDKILRKLQKIQFFPSIEKVSFEENFLEDFSLISKKFRKAKILQLDNNKITSITMDCELLTQLEELFLSKNCISFISDRIDAMKNLKVLDLSQNEKLIFVPDSIGQLTKLQELYLSGCKQLKYLPRTIGNLINLKILEMKQCLSINMLPQKASELSNLQKLYLNNCQNLEYLPQKINNMKNLSILNLNQCYKLKQLPESLYLLQKLSLLFLENCQTLNKLPKMIGQINSLTQIEISLSKLESIPENFGKNAQLKKIGLRYSEIKQLKFGFQSGSCIQILDLSNCVQIERLPQSICNLENLSRLQLQYCKNLIKLPQKIDQLKLLSALNVNSCYKLKQIPNSIMNLTYLFDLNIQSCYSLEELSDGLGCLKGIKQIFLNKNHAIKQLPFTFGVYLHYLRIQNCISLKQLPYSFANATYLKKLEIYDCINLQTLCQSLDQLNSLQELIIRNCPSLKLLHSSFTQQKKLRYFEISKCHSIQILPEMNSSLKILKINYCENLVAIDASIQTYKTIEEIVIQYCEKIQKLDCFLDKIQELKTLQIIYCRNLYQLPQNIETLVSLKQLTIIGCPTISKLPDCFGNLAYLQSLQIEDCAGLERLCTQFGNLRRLQKLKLKKLEKLSILPESLGQCSKLQKLEISYCSSLKDLPTSIENLESLNFFLLKQNTNLLQIPPIPQDKLPKLRSLIISSCNRMKKIGRYQMKNLKMFGIFGSQDLQMLPNHFSEMKQLSKIQLIHCSKLQQIPECFQQLENLLFFTIKYCPSLIRFPQKIFEHMRNLTKLTIVHCTKLQKLPDNFQKLKNLQKLEIRQIHLMKDLPASICQVKKMRILNISSCNNLLSLPTNIGQLTSLQLLVVTNNPNLQFLPENLGLLTNLRQLCLRNNPKLLYLPENLSNLMSLRILDFNQCHKITKIPELPTSIEILEIGDGILQLPDSMNNLDQLRSLTVYNALFLRKLPDQLGGLTNLTELVFKNCCLLKQFPLSLVHIQSLRVFEVSLGQYLPDNIEEYTEDKNLRQFLQSENLFFTSLPENFGNLYNLQSLILKNCDHLAYLPQSISDLFRLKVLDVSGAQKLKEIPIKIESQMNLRVLNCKQCCSLETLPDSLANMSDLQIISVQQCVNLRKLPSSLGSANQKLKVLDLSFCQKLSLIPTSIKNAISLEFLSLKGLKKLSQLANNFFTNLKMLQELYIEGCHFLQFIPSSIEILRKLKILHIMNCWKIQKLPNLQNLLSLEILWIQDCRQLVSLGDNFGNIKSLKVLKLEKLKKLKKLPQSFQQFQKVQFQDLNIDESMTLLKDMQRQIVNNVVASFICRKSSFFGLRLSSKQSQASSISNTGQERSPYSWLNDQKILQIDQQFCLIDRQNQSPKQRLKDSKISIVGQNKNSAQKQEQTQMGQSKKSFRKSIKNKDQQFPQQQT